MQTKDCFLFGTVFKLHGFKGDVNIYNNDNIIIDFNILQYFFIELNNELVPYYIEKARNTKPNIILVKFEDIDSEKEAKKIHKKKVYLPEGWVTKEEEKEIAEKKLIGYTVMDIKLGYLGKVTYINKLSKQQLIYAKKDGIEFCFPQHEEFIKEVDSDKRVMKVNIPKELLNLN
jgi:16S rRNA processing protein RimM